jgi:hypothetical protein
VAVWLIFKEDLSDVMDMVGAMVSTLRESCKAAVLVLHQRRRWRCCC